MPTDRRTIAQKILQGAYDDALAAGLTHGELIAIMERHLRERAKATTGRESILRRSQADAMGRAAKIERPR